MTSSATGAAMSRMNCSPSWRGTICGWSAAPCFGMQPRSSRLVDAGMWWLVHHRERAMWWYNRVFMRVALWFQEELRFSPGLLPTAGVDEVFLVCRRGDWPAAH